MNARIGIWGMLLAIVMLGTGASTEGVRQVRDWQHVGDLAMAGELLPETYSFYAKVAKTVPETKLGYRSQKRALWAKARLIKPSRSPDSENLCTWLGEAIDFVTWP